MNKKILLFLLSISPCMVIYSMKLNFNKPKSKAEQISTAPLIGILEQNESPEIIALNIEGNKIKQLDSLSNIIDFIGSRFISENAILDFVKKRCNENKDEFYNWESLDFKLEIIQKLNSELLNKKSEFGKYTAEEIEPFKKNAKYFLEEIVKFALAIHKENPLERLEDFTKPSNFQCNITLKAAEDLIVSYKDLFGKFAGKIEYDSIQYCSKFKEAKKRELLIQQQYDDKTKAVEQIKSKKTKNSGKQLKIINPQVINLGHELDRAKKESAEAFGLLVDYFAQLAKKTLAFRLNSNLENIDANLNHSFTIEVFKLLASEKIQKLFFEAKDAFECNPSLLEDLYLSMQNYLSLMSQKYQDPKNKSHKGIEWEIEVTYWIFNMLKQLNLDTSSLRMNQHQQIIHTDQDTFSRELDIVSNNFLVECKNIDWDLIDSNSDEAKKLKQQFLDQKRIARNLKKIFCIISKNTIKQKEILRFLEKEKIKFIDPSKSNQANFLIDRKYHKLNPIPHVTEEQVEQIKLEFEKLQEQIKQDKARIEELKKPEAKKSRASNAKRRKKLKLKAIENSNAKETEIKTINDNLPILEKESQKKEGELNSAKNLLLLKKKVEEENKTKKLYSNFNSLYQK